MTHLPSPQARPAAVGWLDRRRDAALACAWIAGIVLASVVALELTGQNPVAVCVGIAGMVLAAWHSVKRQSDMRQALRRAEADRAAIEQALLRSQKMEALGRLTVGVAHDFNNHLTVISSNVEMLARRLDSTQERLHRHTEAALQGVQRAAVLTGRLLAFSHQPAPEPEPVDVDRLLIGLSDLLRRTLGERIGLAVVPPPAPWLTWADVNQMENALLSLTVNARDQVRDGATLTLAVSNVRLDDSVSAGYPAMLPGEYIQISVTDSSQVSQPKVWLPAEDAGSADLSMARGFVREAGGCLLRSDPAARGLSLRLLLPRYMPPAVGAITARAGRGERATILVVEDDAAVRATCVEVLREQGYHVLEAPDAMEAFRLIADQGGIDLLFTDLGLPGGVSGRALADAARNVDPGMRVLFTTGYERADMASRTGTAVLRKPFASVQLVTMVRDVLATAVEAEAVAVAEANVTRSETVGG